MADLNELKVTLSAFSKLISGNTIYMQDKEYNKVEKIAIEQIRDIFENGGKNWKGYNAFKDVK